MMTQQKLFAVYLGGRAPKGNTELHDVVFVTGNTIEDTYEQCLDQWFGLPTGLHLDSWMEMDVVDGHRISLSATKTENEKKLYFVNLGAYKEGAFTEVHANKFIVASNVLEAKTRAKSACLQGWQGPVHTDDLYEVDSCIEVGAVNAFHVVLTETHEKEDLKPNNAYHIVPKKIVDDYMKRNGMAEPTGYRRGFGL